MKKRRAVISAAAHFLDLQLTVILIELSTVSFEH
jgi:hypothetical protein